MMTQTQDMMGACYRAVDYRQPFVWIDGQEDTETHTAACEAIARALPTADVARGVQVELIDNAGLDDASCCQGALEFDGEGWIYVPPESS